MKIEVEISDRLWADFCIMLQDDKCGCNGDLSLHIRNLLIGIMVNHIVKKRIKNLSPEETAEAIKEYRTTGSTFTTRLSDKLIKEYME